MATKGQSKGPADTEEVREAAREAAEQGEDLRESVRNITLSALSEGRIDRERIRSVITAVAEGVQSGAGAQGEEMRETLRETLSGLDEALTKSAEAFKLTFEEASGRMEEFSNSDLKRLADQINSLEETLFSAVREVASSAGDTAKVLWGDLLKHAERNGTAVGDYASKAGDSMRRHLKSSASAGAHAAVETGSKLAEIASGLLAGLADSLSKAAEKQGKSGGGKPKPSTDQD